MRISELAARAGVTPDTIRYYEKMGLLDQSHFCRQANNYRDYRETALNRLELIQQGQTVGFKLSQMIGILGAWEADEISSEQKQTFFQERLAQIDSQIARLHEMREIVLKKLALAHEGMAVQAEIV